MRDGILMNRDTPQRVERVRRADDRGSILIVVSLIVFLLSALSFGFLQEGLAEKASVDLRTSSMFALEICEKGIVEAGLEVLAQRDSGTDGIGFVSDDYAGGDYEVSARQDPNQRDRWILTAKGTHRMATRRIEVGLRRRAQGDFVESLFAKDRLTFNGTTQTDAYDSRLGTYASQATQNDAAGPYASGGGHVGSNQDVVLHGSSVTIRGNAIPGPLHKTSMSGNPTVWGDIVPRRQPIEIPPVSLLEFQTALAANDNAQLLPGNAGGGGKGGGNGKGNGNGGGGNAGGGGGAYNPTTYALSAGAQDIVTLAGGTYIFSSVRLTGQASLLVTGPTRIYVTGDFDVSGGGFVNQTGSPAGLRVFAHPYPLIPGNSPTTSSVKIRGGASASMALYAPGAELSIHGGDDVYGSFVANTITIAGNSRFHYDKALGVVSEHGSVSIERLYWRDLDERVR